MGILWEQRLVEYESSGKRIKSLVPGAGDQGKPVLLQRNIHLMKKRLQVRVFIVLIVPKFRFYGTIKPVNMQDAQ